MRFPRRRVAVWRESIPAGLTQGPLELGLLSRGLLSLGT